jgi:hypothetical protein
MTTIPVSQRKKESFLVQGFTWCFSVLSEATGLSWLRIEFLIGVSISDTFQVQIFSLRFVRALCSGISRPSSPDPRKFQMEKQSKNQVSHRSHSHQLNEWVNEHCKWGCSCHKFLQIEKQNIANNLEPMDNSLGVEFQTFYKTWLELDLKQS